MHCWNIHGFVGFPKDFIGCKYFYNGDKAQGVSAETWQMQLVSTLLREACMVDGYEK